MKSTLLSLIEFIALVVAVIFCVLWFRNRDGSYEPIVTVCVLAGTVLVDLVRRRTGKEPSRKADGIVRIEAEARYVVAGHQATVEEAWSVLTAPFLERHKSWHPSYSDFEPVSIGKDGRPKELEVRGSSGGRYPWRIEEWNDTERILRLWIGPSKNPPEGYKETFLGLTLAFHVIAGVNSVLIEILYKERWTKKPWLTEKECFENGPEREINWIFKRFPLRGKIEYIRELDSSA
ncbi:MAG TPA: hypothetical protein VN493_10810 [Thermoanaerobaculia bacterium]|nr:hypothetical protein [Thermoanaerobaculia bacterium]